MLKRNSSDHVAFVVLSERLRNDTPRLSPAAPKKPNTLPTINPLPSESPPVIRSAVIPVTAPETAPPIAPAFQLFN